MGEMAKKDSLIVMSENAIYKQDRQIENYKEIVKKLNEQIKLNQDICDRSNLEVKSRVVTLNTQITDLRKSRNRWRITALGIPVLIGGVTTFLLLK